MGDERSVDLVIIWRRRKVDEPWRHGPVLYRDADGDVHEHPRSRGRFVGGSPAGDFHYIWRRFVDHMPGNGYSYDYVAHRGVALSELDSTVERIIGPPSSGRGDDPSALPS